MKPKLTLPIAVLSLFPLLFLLTPTGSSQDDDDGVWNHAYEPLHHTGGDDGCYLPCGYKGEGIDVSTVTVCGYGSTPDAAAKAAETQLSAINGWTQHSDSSTCITHEGCPPEAECFWGDYQEVAGPEIPQIWSAPAFSWDTLLYKVCVTAKVYSRTICEDC